jgi:hypothetical protein
MTWSTERVDVLTEMWMAGHSARHISKVLETTRNAIIGKVHRLALPNPEKKLPVTVVARVIREHVRNVTSRQRGPYKIKPRPYTPRPQPKPLPMSEFLPVHRIRATQSPYVFVRETGRARDLPQEHPFSEVPFLKRKGKQCCWPTSGSGVEMWCCGAETMGAETYCADHYYRSRVVG